ncbi:MAG: hydroxyethylthiazole kinase [Pseudomonadota bacterium]
MDKQEQRRSGALRRASPAKDIPRSVGSRLAAMREAGPAVHLISPTATLPFQTDALAAAGGKPMTILTREEVTEVTALTAALSLSIGALRPELLDTMLWAVETARGQGNPWVFDVAEAGASSFRRQPMAALIGRRPAVIASPPADIMTLAGLGRELGAEDTLLAAARAIATRFEAVVAVLADEPVLTDGTRALLIHGGHPVTDRVPGIAAARPTLIAAFLASGLSTGEGAMEAATAALALDAAAGFEAGRRSAGPGSVAMHYLDRLALLSPAELDDVTRITPL